MFSPMLLLLACAAPLPVPDQGEETGCTREIWYRDGDGDGYGDASRGSTEACVGPEGYVAEPGDCDDADAALHPGAVETCDDVDQDCDGAFDEDATDATAWYADTDGDRYGAGAPVLDCHAPGGFVANAEDCDDADPEVSPDAEEVCGGVDEDCDGDLTDGLDAPTWFADADGDGFGDASNTVDACDAPDGFVADDGDCDDTTAAISPDAVEACDGYDDDCDGAVDEGAALDAPTWYADADGDGYGDPTVTMLRCTAPAGYVEDATDCADADAAVHPDAVERCDGIDDDCDGDVDGGAVDAPAWYADTDGDSFGDVTVQIESCDVPSGYVADPTDCDDSDAAVSPVGVETCDGRDEDCDGAVDDGASDASIWYADTDGDGFGDPASTGTGCDAPVGYLADATDCDDTDAAIHPGADETCASAADDDCDGTVDEDPVDGTTWYADADIDGRGDPDTSVVRCTRPSGYLADDSDCDDADPDAHPGAIETCSSGDDDCDGLVDEAPLTDCTTFYLDADGDGHGIATSDCLCAPTGAYTASSTDDCDDGDAASYPGAEEIWADDVDEDCDGAPDRSTLEDVGWAMDGSSQSLLGTWLAAPGDVGADGLSDLVVGAPGPSTGYGAVYWFAEVLDGVRLADAERFDGSATRDAIGDAFAVGDLDGDGTSDLLIGSDAHLVAGVANGAAWVFLDLASGGRAVADADYTVEGDAAEGFGSPVAVLGDLDGDGVEEWAGAAPTSIRVFSGAPTATSDAVWTLDRPTNSGTILLSALDGVGDVDGDGLDDFAVGEGRQDGTSTMAGYVYVLLGSSGPTTGDLDLVADVQLQGTTYGARMGSAVAGRTDCDGDGLADLVVSAIGYAAAGEVYVFTDVPAATDVTSAFATWLGGSSAGHLGTAIAVGDVDGDATDDLIVSEPYSASSALGGGHVLLGCPSGTHTLGEAGITLLGPARSDAGRAVAALGDTDGDGIGDLAFGAPRQDSSTGAVWIVNGR